VTKIKKTFVNVIKNVTSSYSTPCTPDAQEMAFKATRNTPFSLVLQKLSSRFRLAVKSSILCYSWSLTFQLQDAVFCYL